MQILGLHPGRWLIALAAVAPVWGSVAGLTVSIDGLPPDLEREARAHLTILRYSQRATTDAQIQRLVQSGIAQIHTTLETFGYYDSQVSGQSELHGALRYVVFRIELGEPVIVRDVDIQIDGDAADLPEVQRALQEFRPRRDEKLDHAAYEASKVKVQSALLASGYLRAQAQTHQVLVTRSTRSAVIKLRWETLTRYHFGAVHFSATPFSESFLERFIPWKAGDYYSAQVLHEFQRRLTHSGYFAAVAVNPGPAPEDQSSVPIEATLSEAKRSVYSGTLYYSTDTGPGMRAQFEQRWVNTAGHSLRAGAQYGLREKSVSAGYTIPLRSDDLNFRASYDSQTTDTSESKTMHVAAAATGPWGDYTRTLGFEFLSGSFEVAGEPGSSTLLYAEGRLARDRADDAFFPLHGYSVAASLRLAAKGALSDTSFARLAAEAKWIDSTGDHQRWIARGSIGAMVVQHFDSLPPELRFFAGGDRSIRGFDFQAIGSTNDSGKVIGGEYLAVGSIEYERYIWRTWGVALFVDAGDAFRGSDFTLNVGAGAGIRWRSPIGVLRVDFADPVKSPHPQGWRLHINIGPDL